MNIFNNLCICDSQQILNRKNSICIPSDKKKEKLIGTKQYDLEKKIMSYINEIWTKKRWVSRVIVFCYVYEIFLWFKGRKASPIYFSNMKTWFYYGFTKHHQLFYTRIASTSRKLPNDWQDKMRHIIEYVAN